MKVVFVFTGMLISIFTFCQGAIIAHRGASSIAPENTLAAFTKAMEAGADFIEADLRLSADDSLMVIHDETLDRTTNGSGNIDQFGYQELRMLSAGYEKKFGSDYNNEKIPTLFEVLNMTKGRVKVCLDVKNTAEALIIAMIEKMNMESDVYLMSYNVDKLERIKTLNPVIKTVLIKNTITNVDLEVAKSIGASAVSGSTVFSETLAAKAHDKGLEYWVGIVSDPAKAERLFSNHIDAVITDNPQLMTMSTVKPFLISPNPFSDDLLIILKNPEQTQSVTIIDSKGEWVKRFEIPFYDQLKWRPKPDAAKGLYLIYFVQENQVFYQKVLYY
ncbi:MAG: T9SS type A sorting domain-containing protein [Bacteroidetes bacterium]|nr:T9SS type A sorting domain-containing protein [Bacteroidota bacterium]